MKQNDIDRWVNRQNRMNRHTTLLPLNWAMVAAGIVVIVVLVLVLLRAANLL